jgi:hypothetical protein
MSYKFRESIFNAISACSAVPVVRDSDVEDTHEDDENNVDNLHVFDKNGLLYLLNGFIAMKGNFEWNMFPSSVKQVLIMSMEQVKDQYSVDEIPMLLRA